MDIDSFRARVITAIEKFQENGGTLIKGDFEILWDPEIHQWVSPNHCACALSCVLLNEQTPSKLELAEGLIRNIASAVNLSLTDMFNFIDGFDGRKGRVFDSVNPMYDLGKEIRMKFAPVEFEYVQNGPDEDEEDDYDYGRDPEPTDNYGLN